MSGANLIALTDERAAQLEALLKALGPLAPQMQGMSIAFVGLRDSAGNDRTLKLLVADKENSAAADAGQGGIPDGYSVVNLEFCHPTLGNCSGDFLIANIVEI